VNAAAELSPAERKALRARAHALHPILQLGEKGLTDAVIAEIERALAHHELIKVRAAPLNRDERDVALASICERTGAHAIQHIGKGKAAAGPASGDAYSYLTSRISYFFTPPGVCTSTSSPASFPISALAIGEEIEILPALMSASSSPTIW
jgi:putative YhbY family RNA-binding protein